MQSDFFDRLNNLKNRGCYKGFCQVIKDCRACKLYLARTNIVIGIGKIPNDIMLIGEAPGAEEDLEGKPFIGRAGKLLTKLLEEKGISRDDIYLSNTINCRPPQNRNPEEDEVLACRKYLLKQVLLVKPKIMILVGSVALKAIFNNIDSTISRIRGNFIEVDVPYMKRKLFVVPIFHPSYLLRK